MSATATPPAASPSPAPASTATPAAPSTAELISAASNSSSAELESLLGDSPTVATPSVVPPVTPPGDAPVVPPVVPPVAPPAEPPVVDEADPLEGIKGIKIKPSDFQEMEVLRLMKPRDGQKGLTMREAYARVYGENTPTADKAPEAPTAPVKSEFDTQIDTVAAEIADLEKKIDAAADQADTREVSKLTREVSKKERDLERLNDRKAHAEQSKKDQVEQTETNTFRQKQLKSRDELIAKYPVLGDKTSTERREFDEYVKLKSGDPEYSEIFNSPRWPVIMGREFAEAKGLTGAAKPAPTLPDAPPPVAPAAPRVTAATVITPGGPGGQQFQPTLDGLRKDMTTMSTKDLDSLLG